MQNVYKNIEVYNPNKKRKILIVFDDMVADKLSNKNLNSIITEIFVRGRKLNIPLVFITLSYSKVPKKIPNKRRLQQTAFNHSSDIEFKDFMNLYENVLQSHFLF